MSNKFKLKYNYVIVGAGKYYLIGYRDIMQLDNVSFHETHKDGFNTWLEKKLLRLNFSHFVNSIIKTPFARYVYPKLFPHHFVDDKPFICWVFSCIEHQSIPDVVLFCHSLQRYLVFLSGVWPLKMWSLLPHLGQLGVLL